MTGTACPVPTCRAVGALIISDYWPRWYTPPKGTRAVFYCRQCATILGHQMADDLVTVQARPLPNVDERVALAARRMRTRD